MKDYRDNLYLARRQVHVGRTQSGMLGLFDDRNILVIPLKEDENPQIVADNCGWRLAQGADQ